jgi:GWxTD domain-containing protein
MGYRSGLIILIVFLLPFSAGFAQSGLLSGIRIFQQSEIQEDSIRIFLKIITPPEGKKDSLEISVSFTECTLCPEFTFNAGENQNLINKIENEFYYLLSLNSNYAYDHLKISCQYADGEVFEQLFEKPDKTEGLPDLLIAYNSENLPIFHGFAGIGSILKIYSLSDRQNFQVFYYDHEFPVAAPPMQLSRSVEEKLLVDSVFSVNRDSFSLPKRGLYFFQSDTTTLNGTSVIGVDEFYPKPNEIKDLIDPLIYILKSEEYERIRRAEDPKKSFDNLILEMMNSADIARDFVREYYFRVRIANQFYTTYKPGWKTDKGMIFIVFGLPDKILYQGSQEVWVYNSMIGDSIQFEFVRIPNIFSKNHYVLKRNEKYAKDWIRAVRFWRNGRWN